MGKRRGHGTSRSRAIQNALARLGMAASPAQVVAALAEFGIGGVGVKSLEITGAGDQRTKRG
jgi:hypothetical protein